ncbi:MAG: SIR2 family protein [Brumimicrobium sp.]
MELKSLIQNYTSNASQMMWFLGAGTSRSANMPTATDLIWDLKLRHYCAEQGEDIKSHDINNNAIKTKVQGYMDSRGYPKLWSPEEYSFYFELAFGKNYQLQQKYLSDKLSNEHISLNIGHRALAGLLGSKKAKVVFTTNFDEVIEKSYAQVTSQNLQTFNLEGSYAVLEALNQERFPIYAKIHGDFKYQKIKNLTKDLLDNDAKIMEAFIAASTRFGMVVTGYSGRDTNVMEMFNKAIEQTNAFPSGLFWTTTSVANTAESVKSLIAKASQKGIEAHIVEIETFDTLLMATWKQISNVPENINFKIKANRSTEVNISTNENGTNFPFIRTNLLSILEVSDECAEIKLSTSISTQDFYTLVQEKKPNANLVKAEEIHAWGKEEDLRSMFENLGFESIRKVQLSNPISLISENTIYHSLYERALAIALANHPALHLTRSRKFMLIPNSEMASDLIFQPVIDALSNDKFTARMRTSKGGNVNWYEALEISLESRNDKLWLSLKPTIWVEPREERQNHSEALKNALKFRYNKQSNTLLNAWIKVIFQNQKTNSDVVISAYSDEVFPVKFTINTRTAFSKS